MDEILKKDNVGEINIIYNGVSEQRKEEIKQKTLDLLKRHVFPFTSKPVTIEQFQGTNWGYTEFYIKYNDNILVFNSQKSIENNLQNYILDIEAANQNTKKKTFLLKSEGLEIESEVEMKMRVKIDYENSQIKVECPDKFYSFELDNAHSLYEINGNSLNKYYNYDEFIINGLECSSGMMNPNKQDLTNPNDRLLIEALFNKIDELNYYYDFNGFRERSDISDFSHTYGYTDVEEVLNIVDNISVIKNAFPNIEENDSILEIARSISRMGISSSRAFSDSFVRVDNDELLKKIGIDISGYEYEPTGIDEADVLEYAKNKETQADAGLEIK